MKRNKNNGGQKKKAQLNHFARNSLTRVGEILDNKQIVKLIQQNKLEFIDRQSNVITRWKYIHEEKEYMVVYNKNAKIMAYTSLVTAKNNTVAIPSPIEISVVILCPFIDLNFTSNIFTIPIIISEINNPQRTIHCTEFASV